MNRLLRAAAVFACVAFFARPASAVAPNVAFGGEHTITAGEALLHTVVLPNPPLAGVISAQVQAIAAGGNNIAIVPGPGANPNADITITWAAGTSDVTVTDGFFSFAAGQKLRWIAYGTPAVPAVPLGLSAPRGQSVGVGAAGPITINTGYAHIASAIVQIVDNASAVVITADVSVNISMGGSIIVGNGAVRSVGAGQVIRWIAVGN